MDANTYVREKGLNLEVWSGCHLCGSCSEVKKIKCHREDMELQILYTRNVFNLFKNSVVIVSGSIDEMKTKLDAL